MTDLLERSGRPFVFKRDTFVFANELVWQYRFDAATGATTTFRCDPPPTYYHRCFVMVRAARQFLYHARFDPKRPLADLETYRHLVRNVVARDPRRASRDEDRLLVPGYEDLRSFSRAHEPLLKAECGGPWASYFLRSHWRMVLPVSRRHQESMAKQLTHALQGGSTPIVHLFRFPHITINHGIVLYGATEATRSVCFEAYDPNLPDHPTTLIYERQNRTFNFPRTHYWAGGAVNALEVFRNGLY